MRFDGMNTMDGRHLVFAYASVVLVQGGYFLWVLRNWLALKAQQKKSAGPVE
jgi:hypothetical protein